LTLDLVLDAAQTTAANCYLNIGMRRRLRGDNAMKVHERARIVDLAECDLSEFALKLRQQHALSYIEYLGMLNREAARVLKYALREERHPDEPDKPSGLA
jgi:hypothetical protein